MLPIKIIVVDDHKIFRTGIKALMLAESNYQIINEAENYSQLFEVLKTQHPDIVLLDIELPKVSGIEITKKIAIHYPDIKVLILSADQNEYTIAEAINAGAMGYLHKDISKTQLLAAIRSIVKKKEYYGNAISNRVLNENKVLKSYLLTNREIEIIRFLTKGLKYKVIAEKLNISPRTVEKHKTNIMSKLDINSIAELIKFAVKHNMIDI